MITKLRREQERKMNQEVFIIEVRGYYRVIIDIEVEINLKTII
jgi:hypothetical protein